MAMVDASLVLDAIVAVSIAAGAFFAVIELRDMKKDRRVQLMLQAGAHIATREFEDALGKIWRADASNAKELEKQVSYTDLSMVADYLDFVAGLVIEGLVDKRAIVNWPYDYVWKKIGPWVNAEREAANIPTFWTNIEKVARLQEKSGRDFAFRKSP